MAVSFPRLYKNAHFAGNIDTEQCEFILNVRSQESVSSLEKYLFNFPINLVEQSIAQGRSIRRIVKEENIDYTSYMGKLKPYQTVGTAFLLASQRSILGDGVGLGKTAEVAALLNFLKQRGKLNKFIIAVENSALGQTAYEMIKFTGLYVIALPSTADKLKRVIKNTDWSLVDGVVIKHSSLKSDTLSSWLASSIDYVTGKHKEFNTFILDEGSVIKNDTTKTYRYTENICNMVERAHILNATTFETSIMDIYHQVNILDTNILPKAWRIEKEYSTYSASSYWTKENGIAKRNTKYQRSGYKNQEKFKESLKLVYFGRSKKDIGMDMPHIHKVYTVEPTAAQLVAIQQKMRYMEVLNCPSLTPEAGIKFTRKEVPKLERLISLIETEFIDSKVMIYCFHTDAQKVIAKELKAIGRKPAILNGEVVDEERTAIQRKFNDGTVDILITNIKKSLNLYGGDACIFYTVETNPASMEQITGRIDRNVDDRVKTFILLVYEDTDEYRFLTQVVRQRAEDARSLTIDAKTAVDYFMESMEF